MSPTSAITKSTNSPRIVAVIGTAGRDASIDMTRTLWRLMCEDLSKRINPSDHLVSGGAAWADHLAVHAYLNGQCKNLTLFLPAPIANQKYEGPLRSAGSTANYFHKRFTDAIAENTLEQISVAIQNGARVSAEPAAPGFAAMFARNRKVAQLAQAVIAYTFHDGEEPLPGGTLDTWRQIRSSDRTHIDLRPILAQALHLDMQSKQAAIKATTKPATKPRFSFTRPTR